MGENEFEPFMKENQKKLYRDDSNKAKELELKLKGRGLKIIVNVRPGSVPILDEIDNAGKQISPHCIGYDEIRTLYLL